MQTERDTRPGAEIDLLLKRGFTPHRIALEDFVAYQWEADGDILGHRHGGKRTAVALAWLADAVKRAGRPAAVIDVGCSYGNHLFMLNALLGKPADVEMVGVDLFAEGVRRANLFAKTIPGFSNCRFEVADLSGALPFKDNSFDGLNLCDVIEHMVAPGAVLRELCRIVKPGGAAVISTPLKDSLFKRLATFGNKLVGGRLYKAYYKGKNTELDEEGNPVMENLAGHDHVSEMTLPVLKRHCEEAGFSVEEVSLMSVMSGSRWFDKHLVLLSGIFLLEAVHDVLKRPSWAHSVMLRLRKK